jgi:hypothetical protein
MKIYWNGKLIEETEDKLTVIEGSTKIYGNGWVFEGRFKNKALNGNGVVKYDDGSKENVKFDLGTPLTECSKRWYKKHEKEFDDRTIEQDKYKK